VADAPTLTVQAASGQEDTAISLNIASALKDTDGSETLALTITGVPSGASLSTGTNNGNGSWTLTPDQLSGLTVTPPANSDSDFTLTVTATSKEGENTSTATKLASLQVVVAAAADAPILTAAAASGDEDGTIALHIESSLSDRDGSETLGIVIGNVPDGTRLTAGTDNGDGTWTLTPAQLEGLAVRLAPNSGDDFELTINAISTETSTGARSITTTALPVTVNAVADTPLLSLSSARGAEDSAIRLSISSSLTDTDGSESLGVVIRNVPDGATLSAGTDNGDGTWTLTPAQLEGLTITPPPQSDADFTLSVSAIATEGENASTAQQSYSLPVTVSAVADLLSLGLSEEVAGGEDTRISLNINADLIDADGSESLTLTLGGVPVGASLSAGTDNGDGTWSLTLDQLADLKVSPPADSDVDFTLTLTANTLEEANGDTRTTTLAIPVQVTGVADAANLTAGAAVGLEDRAIALNLGASLNDTDGSESLAITIAGLPEGARLSAGTLNDDGSYTLTRAQLSGLTITPPSNSDTDFHLTVTATSSEREGDSHSTTIDHLVTVQADADAPTLSVQKAAGLEDNAIGLSIASRLTDLDGSESLAITISGIPTGATLSAGTRNPDGSYTLTPAQLTELTITPAADSDRDFNLTVTARSTEGENSDSAATVLTLPVSVSGVADTPTITAGLSEGLEDHLIPLNLSPVLADRDGSESISLIIDNLPEGARLSAGTDNGDGTWTVANNQLDGLSVLPPADSNVDFTLRVTAVATETSGGSSARSAPVDLAVAVTGVADTPELTIAGATGDEDTAIALDIASSLTDVDGSESLAVTIAGVPTGASLSAGTDNGNGTWTLTRDQLAGLTVTPPTDADGSFNLTVTATAAENDGDTASVSYELPVIVNGVADAPVVTAGPVAGKEDTAIALDLSVVGGDLDGSEGALQILVRDVPEGAQLSAGSNNGDGTWTLKQDDLKGLSITPPADAADDFKLNFEVTSTESGSGHTTATSFTVPVEVTAVADGMTLRADSASGYVDQRIALNLVQQGLDRDGSETGSFVISNVPDGAILSAGNENPDGSWTLTADELRGLTVTPPAGSDADFTLTVTGTSTEAENQDSVSSSVELPVYVRTPSGGGGGGGGDDSGTISTREDSPVTIDLASRIPQLTDAVKGSITISGVPEGATLSAGTDNGDGTWTVTTAEAADLTLTPAAHSGDNIYLQFSAELECPAPDTEAEKPSGSITVGEAETEGHTEVDEAAVAAQGLTLGDDGRYYRTETAEVTVQTETAKLMTSKTISVGRADSIRLDEAPEFGTVEIQGADGNWNAMTVGRDYAADSEVRLVPDNDAITQETRDIRIGTFGDNTGTSRFTGHADVSDWGTVSADGTSVVYQDGDLSVTTTISEGRLAAYNGSGDHVGAGIGDNDYNGLSEDETLTIAIDGAEVNQVVFTLDGLGVLFDRSSFSATKVDITAYDTDGNVIDAQGGYRDSGQYADTYSFTTNVPVASFELGTSGGWGQYVVQNMTLSKTISDDVTFTATYAGGTEITLTSNLNIESDDFGQTMDLAELIPAADQNVTREVQVIDTEAMAAKGAFLVDGTWVVETTETRETLVEVETPRQTVVDSYTYPVDLSAALADTDGSEQLSLVLLGVPDGAKLSSGTDNGDGTWTVRVEEGTTDFKGSLTMTTTQPLKENIGLTVTATESGSGETQSVTVYDGAGTEPRLLGPPMALGRAELALVAVADIAADEPKTTTVKVSSDLLITVTDVADAPALTADEVRAVEHTATELGISASLVDSDGSERLAITISGVPAGAVLSAGTENGDGSWTLTSAELKGLTITPPNFSSEDFVLKVSATSTEYENGSQASTSFELPVTVSGSANAPVLAIKAGAGAEDSAITLHIDPALTDTDGSESLAVTIGGVPAGAVLSAGSDNGDGTWTVTQAELADLTITPPAQSGEDFTLTVTATTTEADSGSTATTVRSLPVIVNAVADALSVASEATAGSEDTAISLGLTPVLIDSDGSEVVSIVAQGLPDGAVLSAGTRNDDGSWNLSLADLDGLTVTPPANSDGDFAISFTATTMETENGSTAVSEFSVPVSVAAAVDGVAVSAGAVRGREDSAIALNIGATLSDTDGSESTAVTISGVPAGARLSAGSDNGDGSWTLSVGQLSGLTVTPPANAADDFTLTLTTTSSEARGDAVTSSYEIPVTVTAVADSPALTATTPGGREDQAIALNISSALRDTDGSETLSAVTVRGVPAGAILSAGTDNGDGSWTLTQEQLDGLTITPPTHSDSDFTLSVSASASESEGDRATSTVNIAVSVAAVATTPELAATAATGSEDRDIPLDISAALADTDGSESLSVTISGVPSGARLSAGSDNGDGTWTLTSDQLDGLSIRPPRDSGDDFALSVTATATEAGGESTSSNATVNVTVNAVADAPQLRIDSAGGSEDRAIALDIRSSLTDTDGSESLAVTIGGIPDGAQLSAGTNNGDGTWTLSRDQLSGLTITPPADSDGDFNLTVTATATEAEGAQSSTSYTLPVSVEAVADGVRFSSAASGDEDTAIRLHLGAVIADRDGSETMGDITISGLPTGAILSAGTDNPDGTWTLSVEELDGLTITPPVDSGDNFNLTVSATTTESSSGAAITTTYSLPVTVQAVADTPILSARSASGSEDRAIALSISTGLTDSDGSEQLTGVTLSGVPTGAVLSAGTDNGDGTWTVAQNELAGLTITPPADSSDDFTLSLSVSSVDSSGSIATGTAQLPVRVTAVADAPILTVDDGAAITVLEDRAIPIHITAGLNDTDGSEQLSSVTISGVPEGAVLSAGTDNGNGTWTLSQDELAQLTITPPADSNEDFTLNLSLTSSDADGASATSTTQVQVAVTGVADAPTLTATAARGDEDTAITLDIRTALADADGSEHLAAVTISGVPEGAVLSAGTDNGDGTWSVNAEDLTGLTLTPPENVNGEIQQTINATSVENDGDTATSTGGATITVNAVNDVARISGTASGTVAEDASLSASGTLAVSDVDSGEEHFTAASFDGTYGSLTLGEDGNWTYTLDNDADNVQALGQGDAATETFTVTSADGTEQQITVDLSGTNDAAVFTGTATGAVTEDSDSSASGTLTVSDVDSGEASFSAATQDGTYGSLAIDESGQWTYNLNNDADNVQALGAGDTVSDSFTVTSADGTEQRITVNLSGTNDTPEVTVADTATVDEDGTLTVSAADFSVTDVEDGVITPVLSADHGSAEIVNGNIVYTPDENFSGNDTITVAVHDAAGATAAQDIAVTVTAIADAPVIDMSTTETIVTSTAQMHWDGIDTSSVNAVFGSLGSMGDVSDTASTGTGDAADSMRIEHIAADSPTSSYQTGGGDDTVRVMYNDGGVDLGEGNNALNVYYGDSGSISAGNGNNAIYIYSAANGDITTGSGDDTVYVGHEINANVALGDGDNQLQAYYSIGINNTNTTVTAGSGDDFMYFRGGTKQYGDVDLNAGDGNNYIHSGYLYNGEITTGTGNDTVLIDGHSYQDITTGAGNDYVRVGGDTVNRASINLGEGDNYVHVVGQNNDIITSGSGNDTAVFDRNTTGAINLGAGDDLVVYTNTTGQFNVTGSVDGGEGNDSLYLKGVTSDGWNNNVDLQSHFANFENVMLGDGEVARGDASGLPSSVADLDTAMMRSNSYTFQGTTGTETVTRSLTGVSGDEDTAIALPIKVDLTDTDGSESISSIVLSGMPAGSVLSAGTDNGDGSWTLSRDQLTGLTFTPPADANGTMEFTVTASSTESNEDTASAARTFSVQVNPVNDNAIIAGTATGAVAEDGDTTASGTLTVSDVDSGEAAFTAATQDGTYGSLTLGEDGNWSYTLDNDADNVQAMGAGDTAFDSFTVTSADGTRQQITVNFSGANDAVGAVSDTDAASNAVAENSAAGAAVGITARATDIDGDSVSYSLSDDADGRFAIDGASGVVSVAEGADLDFETAASHDITVRATSSDGSSSEQGFTVQVSDVEEAVGLTLVGTNAADTLVGGDGNDSIAWEAPAGRTASPASR